MTSDLELLEIEIDLLWRRDERGRLVDNRRWPGYLAPQWLTHLAVANSNSGRTVAIGSKVPDASARELEALIAAGAPSPDPATRPAAFERCGELLADTIGAVEERSSRVYVIPANIGCPSTADICLSNSLDGQRPTGTPPEDSGWTREEWGLLLAGSFGPWAMAILDGRVVSICHTPVPPTGRAAEAGVWTHPASRGQGHAAAVTAAWASLFAPTGRHLFYSTAGDNVSSQRVAGRLGLRCIGWTWQLGTRS